MSHPCRWAGSDRPRVLVHRHADDCPGDCPGCLPCPEPHCRMCGIRHAPTACTKCVGDIRDNLAAVVELAGHLPDEAEHRGVQSEAAHLAGPTAQPEAWRQRGRYGHRYTPDARLGENHPLWVLGTWDLMTAEHLSHRRTGRVTVKDAAAYLDANLTWLAADVEYPIDDLAADLRTCRAHLEDVLRDGEQIEKGAPCLTCKRPVTRTMNDDGSHAYRCERCRRNFTDNEYRLAVRAAHVAHADRLCADDLSERIRVPASTIRSWASAVRIQRDGEKPHEAPPLLRACGRDGRGRKVYRVSDALGIRDGGGDGRRRAIVSNDGAA